MNIWSVSREYAGIAEAGGVKNVARSLAEALVRRGHRVTLFIPLYACTDIDAVEQFECVWHEPVFINRSGTSVPVSFCHGMLNGVDIVFISHRQFAEKKAVYVYTQEDEDVVPTHRHGTGHIDALELNVIFQKAVVAFGDTCSQADAPDIIHCQDATAALVPSLMHFKMQLSPLSAQFFKKTKCVVTIHNAGPGYHHQFDSFEQASFITSLPASMLYEGLVGQKVEPFMLAAKHARLTTVSPQYAQEILNGTTETDGLGKAFKESGISITGITNGIDFDNYDPRNTSKSHLPFAFDPEHKELRGKYLCRKELLEKYAHINAGPVSQVVRFGHFALQEEAFVLISYHGRIVHQKGIEILIDASRQLLQKKLPVKIVCIGQGESELEDKLAFLSREFAGSFVFFKGYDRSLSRLCTASADFSLFPSLFEPCGLEDFISQLYGTIPLAHATGGLCKIIDEETGFLYKPDTSEKMLEILEPLIRIKISAPDIFLPMIAFAAQNTHAKYNWQYVAAQYESLYNEL
ncbi:MAG TPA: hypothetical protein DC014_07060 [Treponema sp.]|nr:hypothetical protein [Treponema sp.]